MNTCECQNCGHWFWSDDPDQAQCPTCVEEPVAERNRQRAAEMWVEYIKSTTTKPE